MLAAGVSEMASPLIGGLLYEGIGYSHSFEVAIGIGLMVMGAWLIFGRVFDRKE